MTIQPLHQKDNNVSRNQKSLAYTHISNTFPEACNEKKKNHVNHESSVLLHLLYYSCLFSKVLFFSFSSKEQSEAILITELKLKHDELPQGTLRKEGRRPARVCVMMQQHQVSNVSHFSVLFPRRDLTIYDDN